MSERRPGTRLCACCTSPRPIIRSLVRSEMPSISADLALGIQSFFEICAGYVTISGCSASVCSSALSWCKFVIVSPRADKYDSLRLLSRKGNLGKAEAIIEQWRNCELRACRLKVNQ